MLIIFQKYWKPKRLGVGREEGKRGTETERGGEKLKVVREKSRHPTKKPQIVPCLTSRQQKMEARRQGKNIFSVVRKWL